MSRFDYESSRRIEADGHSFAALIMAAMRKADTTNYALLTTAFPEIGRELEARYNAAGGLLSSDQYEPGGERRLPSATEQIHIATTVFDEDDFGKYTFCGVVKNDRSAVAPSMLSDYPTWRICDTCKSRRHERIGQ